QSLEHEGARRAAVDDRLIVGELDIGPDAAGEQPLMLVDEFRFDVNEIEAARRQTRPVFAALILLVEGYCAEVDDLHRALLLEAGLDELALVRAHDALADGLLHLLEACLDFVP